MKLNPFHRRDAETQRKTKREKKIEVQKKFQLSLSLFFLFLTRRLRVSAVYSHPFIFSRNYLKKLQFSRLSLTEPFQKILA